MPAELREPAPAETDADDESISFHVEDDEPSVDTEAVTMAAPFDLAAAGEDSGDEDSMGDIVQRGIDALHGGDRWLAVDLFERALRRDPDDGVARTYLDVAHDLVIQDQLPGAGLNSVPRLRVGREMLMTLELDPQAGGVLAMVDGLATMEDLETMLPYFDRQTIYRHLATALADGLIEFDE